VATTLAVRGPRGTTTVWVVGDPQGGDEWLGFGRGAWWQWAKEIEWGRCRQGLGVACGGEFFISKGGTHDIVD
jgi:hypothetical protein